MTNEEAIKYLKQLYPNGGHCWLDEQRIEAISMAVKALQERPVSEQNLSNVQRTVKDWKEEPVSEELEKAHNWKPADGDDLPDIDREVIVLIKYNTQRNIHDEEYPTYRVGFGHRPNPDGWDGKNIDTNEVTHYTPELYDKGGLNAPNIVYWLDYDINELLCR